MAVRILSFVRSRKPRNGVKIYGTCQSISRPHRVNHTVVFKGGKWFCSCEAGLFGNPCEHSKAFRAKARKLAALLDAPPTSITKQETKVSAGGA